MQKKKEYVQSVAMHETFMESVPTFLIMTFLMVRAFNDETLQSIIFDYTRLDSVLLFVTTFSSSGLSSCFGLTKCLKNSVAAVIAPVGPAEGVLSARFVLAFFGTVEHSIYHHCLYKYSIFSACSLAFVSKAAMFAFVAIFYHKRAAIVLTFLLLFLPGLVLGLVLVLDRRTVAVVWRHPHLLLMPAFTYFTFSRRQVALSSRDSRVQLSLRYSGLNMVLSCLAFLAVFALVLLMFDDIELNQRPDMQAMFDGV